MAQPPPTGLDNFSASPGSVCLIEVQGAGQATMPPELGWVYGEEAVPV